MGTRCYTRYYLPMKCMPRLSSGMRFASAIRPTRRSSRTTARPMAHNLMQLWPNAINIVRRPQLREEVRDVLGPQAGVVRILFFDKPPGHSWALPWHKDYTIAVERHGVEGTFTKPTTKAGVPHVIAPFEILDRMLTVRFHLDDMNEDNGPLRVLAGSHRAYHQGQDEKSEIVSVHCRAGDALLMRPLLTHASGHCKGTAGHRRIIHVECAPEPGLPDGYQWHDFIPIEEPPGTISSSS